MEREVDHHALDGATDLGGFFGARFGFLVGVESTSVNWSKFVWAKFWVVFLNTEVL